MGEQVPHGHWNSWENRRQLFDSFMIEMGMDELSDWYSIRTSHLRETGSLWGVYTGRYSSRLVNALEDVYPEFDWVAWEFAKIPQGFVDVWKNRKMLADWFMKEQGWGILDDWYSCTTRILKRSKLNSMLTHVYNSSLIDIFHCHLG